MAREGTASAAHTNVARPLTKGEIALCGGIFPGELPYSDVRLCDGPIANLAAERAFAQGNTAITLRRTIYFRVRYCPDFSAGDPKARELFLHEMTHVWQWHRLGVMRFLLRYARELAAAGFKPNAMYCYGSGVPFSAAMLEAQAEMVGHYPRANLTRKLIAECLTGTGFHGL